MQLKINKTQQEMQYDFLQARVVRFAEEDEGRGDGLREKEELEYFQDLKKFQICFVEAYITLYIKQYTIINKYCNSPEMYTVKHVNCKFFLKLELVIWAAKF